MISASVLSSFSFSLLWVIHDLTSWTHCCMDWMSSSTCCGGADFCNWVSSAKEWWRTEWLSITSETVGCYRTKRTGLRRDPCGTLQLMVTGAELQLYAVIVFEFCLWGKKRTSGEQDHLRQRHVQVLEKNGMVYCIKGIWKIKQSKNRYVSMVKRAQKVIHTFQKGCLSAVYRSVGRLKWLE